MILIFLIGIILALIFWRHKVRKDQFKSLLEDFQTLEKAIDKKEFTEFFHRFITSKTDLDRGLILHKACDYVPSELYLEWDALVRLWNKWYSPF